MGKIFEDKDENEQERISAPLPIEVMQKYQKRERYKRYAGWIAFVIVICFFALLLLGILTGYISVKDLFYELFAGCVEIGVQGGV